MYSKEAPADLQFAWQEFFGEFIKGSSILDIGSGRGLSKERLSLGNNQVFTSDANRALMKQVDFIVDSRDLVDFKKGKSWDYVTAFDVIEHVNYDPKVFIQNMISVSGKGIVFTTPNGKVHTAPWHYKPEEVIDLIKNYENKSYYSMKKHTSESEVKEVSLESFLKDQYNGMGVMILK